MFVSFCNCLLHSLYLKRTVMYHSPFMFLFVGLVVMLGCDRPSSAVQDADQAALDAYDAEILAAENAAEEVDE